MKHIAITFLFIVLVTDLNAQLAIKNSKRLPDVKKGTTYVVMQNPKSKQSQNFIAVFKKYWTFSAIDFITEDEMPAHYDATSSFLTLTESNNSYVANNTRTDYVEGNFELWMCEPGFLKKKEGAPTNKQRDVIASLVMYFHNSGEGKKPSYKLIDLYEAEDHDYSKAPYWTPGLVANYIQRMTTAMGEGKDMAYGVRVTKTDELSKLKNDTLFIPEWVTDGEKYLFDGYPYHYQILGQDELSYKILNSTKPFYYILYKTGLGMRAINIINSQTGDYIYTRYPQMLGGLGKNEVKELTKSIGK